MATITVRDKIEAIQFTGSNDAEITAYIDAFVADMEAAGFSMPWSVESAGVDGSGHYVLNTGGWADMDLSPTDWMLRNQNTVAPMTDAVFKVMYAAG